MNRPVSARHLYKTYGLVISSDIELPELLPADSRTPDVEIISSPIPQTLEGASDTGSSLQYTDEQCQFVVDGIARYRIEQGRRIFVDCLSTSLRGQSSEFDGVRLFLLGSAFGALLHQRRWLPLHISALATPSGVWAFSGPSGAGKSTLAAWLNRREGWPVICDDVAVMRPDEELPYLYAGPPRLKLWKNTLARLGINKQNLIRDLMRVDKYHLDISKEFSNRAQPLNALVMLEQAGKDEAPSLMRIKDTAAFQCLMQSLYRPEFSMHFNTPLQLLRDCAWPLNKIKVYKYRRQWSLEAVDEGLQPLLNEIHHQI